MIGLSLLSFKFSCKAASSVNYVSIDLLMHWFIPGVHEKHCCTSCNFLEHTECRLYCYVVFHCVMVFCKHNTEFIFSIIGVAKNSDLYFIAGVNYYRHIQITRSIKIFKVLFLAIISVPYGNLNQLSCLSYLLASG